MKNPSDKRAIKGLESAARKAGDQLVAALNVVKKKSPSEAVRWTPAVGAVMADIYNKLLAPLWVDHPTLRPPWFELKEDVKRQRNQRSVRPKAKPKRQ